MEHKTNKIANMMKEAKTMTGQKLTPRHLAQITKVLSIVMVYGAGMFMGAIIECGFVPELVAVEIIAIVGAIIGKASEKAFLEEAETEEMLHKRAEIKEAVPEEATE